MNYAFDYREASPLAVGGLRLVRRAGTWYMVGTRGGERFRLSTKSTDVREARAVMQDFVRELDSGWRAGADDQDLPWQKIAAVIVRRHQSAAALRGIPFSLKPPQVFALMQESGFRCVVSGIAFSRRLRQGFVDPWGASLDRIESRHSYTIDNVRVVCLAANLAMNQWGYDTLLRLSRSVVANAASATVENVTKLAREPDDA